MTNRTHTCSLSSTKNANIYFCNALKTVCTYMFMLSIQWIIKSIVHRFSTTLYRSLQNDKNNYTVMKLNLLFFLVMHFFLLIVLVLYLVVFHTSILILRSVVWVYFFFIFLMIFHFIYPFLNKWINFNLFSFFYSS